MSDSDTYKALSETSNGLKDSAFNALLAALDPEAKKAGIRYEQLRQKLIRLFIWRACPDAEALADETINRVARRISADRSKSHKVEPFSMGVAHRIYMEVLRSNKQHRNAVDEIQAQPPGLFDREMTDPGLIRLERCILELPDADRQLILAYYQFEAGQRINSRQKIQRELGLSASNLRIKVYRIRNRLERRMQQLLRESATGVRNDEP